MEVAPNVPKASGEDVTRRLSPAAGALDVLNILELCDGARKMLDFGGVEVAAFELRKAIPDVVREGRKAAMDNCKNSQFRKTGNNRIERLVGEIG